MSKLTRARAYIGKVIRDHERNVLVKDVVFQYNGNRGLYFKGSFLNQDGTVLDTRAADETMLEHVKARLLDDDINDLLAKVFRNKLTVLENRLLQTDEERNTFYVKVNSRCRHDIVL